MGFREHALFLQRTQKNRLFSKPLSLALELQKTMPQLITIASFNEPLEAYIVKGRLEAEGIPTYIAHEHHISVAWYLSNALGGVKIQIRKEDKDFAKNILNLLHSGDYEEELKKEISNTESNLCPNCGSTEYKSKFSLPLLLLVWLSLGFAVIFPIYRSHHKCKACGCKWVY